MKTLVVAEYDGKTLKDATRSTLTAAHQLGFPVDVVVLGSKVDEVVKSLTGYGCIQTLHVADHPALEAPLAEPYAKVLANLTQGYTHLLAPATTFGKNILPRAAALLDVGQVSDVIAIQSPDTFTRPIYAGNALMTVKVQDPFKVLTIRPTAFDKMAPSGTAAKTQAVSIDDLPQLSTLDSFQASVSARPDLTSARVVISGGRGLQSGENFKLLENLADLLNAAIGASRAAVDAGYVPNDYQVGQTGKVVAPELYIAVGISGAIQHLAGMKDSKVIVAINKDADAPIFQIADYGLVGDLFEILPELTKALSLRGVA